VEGEIRRAGANHPVQGTNADITKLAMIGIAQKLQTLDCRIIGQIYDEIIVEVPENEAVYAAVTVLETMTASAKSVLKRVPVVVDVAISPTWNEKDGITLNKLLTEVA
jgi:DNA polymerase-1